MQRTAYPKLHSSSRDMQQTHGAGALQRYNKARDQGLKPTTPILLSALKACTTVKDVASGLKIHKYLLETTGSVTNIFLANALIDMYSKCNCLDEAHQVFQTMPHRSLVSWNTIIMAYAQAGQADTAHDLFSGMQQQGFMPDARTFVSLLKAYSTMASKGEAHVKKRCLANAQDVHRHLSNLRLDSNRFISSSLVDVYVKCGCMEKSREVFDQIKSLDSVSWNSIIMGYTQNGEGELALHMFQRMLEGGYKPDERTFVAAVNACARLAEAEDGDTHIGYKLVKVVNLERGMAIHSRLKTTLTGELDPFVASALVDMYSKSGSLLDALRVFDSMQMPDLVSWNALVLGYAQSGEQETSLRMFASEATLEPDARTYVAALNACSSLAEGEELDPELNVKVVSLERGMAVHSRLSDEPDMFLGSSLVNMYSKCGCMTDALRVFQRMQRRDVVSWNTMVTGYVQSNENEQAVEFFIRMQDEGVEPDVGTYTAVVKACGKLAELETGRRVHARITSGELGGEKHVANSLVSMYGKCGAMEEAEAVFNSMKPETRDLVTWSALITGYCHQGNSAKVFSLFEEMRKERLHVDGVVFLSVLTLCCHAGLVDKGREYFRLMCCDYGIAPGVEHFTCMVDLLGKANYLDEAVAMVKSMPFEADVTVWTVLLDACRKWKNVEVGKFAFEAILRLNNN